MQKERHSNAIVFGGTESKKCQKAHKKAENAERKALKCKKNCKKLTKNMICKLPASTTSTSTPMTPLRGVTTAKIMEGWEAGA